jgi:hypothetical protein
MQAPEAAFQRIKAVDSLVWRLVLWSACAGVWFVRSFERHGDGWWMVDG